MFRRKDGTEQGQQQQEVKVKLIDLIVRHLACNVTMWFRKLQRTTELNKGEVIIPFR